MVNKLIYQGRLTKDIELKHTQSNVAYCEFTIAWSEKYKEVETKCFLRCKAWRTTAEFLPKYFSKGKEIAIEGHMTTEEWDDKEGQHQTRTICLIDKVHFCGSKGSGSGSSSAPAPAAPTDENGFMDIPEGAEDDGLPFD